MDVCTDGHAWCVAAWVYRGFLQSRDKASLEQYLVKAAELSLQAHPLFEQAKALKQRMEEEEACRQQLRAAITARTIEALTTALDHTTKMGLDEEQLAKDGAALREFLVQQVRVMRHGAWGGRAPPCGCVVCDGWRATRVLRRPACLRQNEARQALRDAVAARVLVQLDSALAQASRAQLPADAPEVVEAGRVKARLLEEEAVERELFKVAESTDIAAIEAVIARATAMSITVCDCARARLK